MGCAFIGGTIFVAGLASISLRIPHETGRRAASATYSFAGAAGVIVLVPFAVALILSWFCRIGLAKAEDFGPAQLAYHVRLYIEGAPLYPDCRIPRSIPLAYGPVTFWITALLSRFFGSSPMAPLEAGRLLVLCATLSCAALIYRLGRRDGAGAAASLICAMAFVLSPLLEPYGFAFRVDMPALAFDLAGIALIEAGLAYPAVALFVLCYLTKQARVAGIGAALLYVWLNGDRRKAIRLAALYLAGLAMATVLLQFHYPYFWMNNYDSLMLVDDFSAALRFFSSLTVVEFPILALAAAAIFTKPAKRSVTVCFLIMAVVQDLFSCLHWGSNLNYFFPTLAAASAAAAAPLDYLIERSRNFMRPLQLGFAIAIAWAILAPIFSQGAVADPGMGAGIKRFRFWTAYQKTKASSWDPMLQQVSSIHGTILTDIGELALVDKSQDIWFLDLIPLKALHERGVYDDRPLIAALNGRKIAAVALDGELLSRNWRGRSFFWPELREAIERNYTIASSTSMFLAVPKQEPN